MAFVHGRDVVILLDKYNITGYCDNVDLPVTMEVHETTVFGKKFKTYAPGLKDATLGLQGLFDGAATAQDELISDTLSNTSNPPAAKIWSIGFNNLTRGNTVKLLNTHGQSYTPGLPVGDMIRWSYDAQCTASTTNSVECPSSISGVSLHDLTAVSASADDASVNNLASSANGLVAHLHVTAVTAVGGDTLTVDVSDSSDNITFVDKITFAQVTTAITSERKAVTGTINQYLRVEKTKGGGGTPSWTMAVTAARL